MIIRPVDGKHIVTVKGITVSCATFRDALRAGWFIALGSHSTKR
ncbi:hypothetical protein [Ferrimonas lipolytica]|nr:hypothetical protein [Ferrimonas lipolytica]